MSFIRKIRNFIKRIIGPFRRAVRAVKKALEITYDIIEFLDSVKFPGGRSLPLPTIGRFLTRLLEIRRNVSVRVNVAVHQIRWVLGELEKIIRRLDTGSKERAWAEALYAKAKSALDRII